MVTDDFGNAATLDLGLLRSDFTAPADINTNAGGLVTYFRVPWGSDATSGQKGYFLRGLASAAEASAEVVVYDGSDLQSAAPLGRTVANADGSFGDVPGNANAFEIASANLPAVYVAQEDPAGNSSNPTLVMDGFWTATMGSKVKGSTLANPHHFWSQWQQRNVRLTSNQVEPDFPTDVATSNNGNVQTDGLPHWQRVPMTPGAPSKRGGCAMDFDSDRGNAILFGGYWDQRTGGKVFNNETWEWNGHSWRALPFEVKPEGRGRHSLVYDQARRRFVLFGGCNGDSACSTVLGDTWELTEHLVWERVCWPGCTPGTECSCTDMPTPRTGAAMFYDIFNGHTVLFGGEDVANGDRADMWVWDGEDWTEQPPSPRPSPRSEAALNRHPVTGEIMLVSGGASNDVWFWDGDDWTIQAGTRDVGGDWYSLFYDSASQTMKLVFPPSPYHFEWEGTDWQAGAPTSISLQQWDHSFTESMLRGCQAYDTLRDHQLYFGGCLGTNCRDDFEAQGGTWFFRDDEVVEFLPGQAPRFRSHAAHAYNPGTEIVTLFGGKEYDSRDFYQDTWFWNGLSWRGDGLGIDTSFTGLGRWGGAMATFENDKTLVFGGTGYSTRSDGMHTHYNFGNDFTWTHWAGDYFGGYYDQPASVNLEMGGHALAWDPVLDEAVYFRGYENGDHTWTMTWTDYHAPWDMHGPTEGALWTAESPTNEPSSTAGHAMAYCASAGGVILFGGHDGADYLNEQWRWSGSDWVSQSPSSRPPARSGHVMFCDSDRNKIFVAGGENDGGILHDVWEFDGTTWRERTPPRGPIGRVGAAAVYMPTKSHGIFFGGDNGGYLGDTWKWNAGSQARPAHVLSANFAHAEVFDDAEVRGVATVWQAGGQGRNGGGSVDGVTLSVWDGGNWRDTGASNNAGTGSASGVAWSSGSSAEWTSLSEAERLKRLRRLFSGENRELSFAVAPVGTNLEHTDLARVRTDYVETNIRYRLLCRAAGVSTEDPGRCCSGNASGGICQ
jgi:hypothetical protein